jgi:ATP-dependent exoDNAse (exonuclease V) beta subunit
VLVDNSSAVEGFGVSAKTSMIKETRRIIDNVNVMYVALTRQRSNCMLFQI